MLLLIKKLDVIKGNQRADNVVLVLRCVTMSDKCYLVLMIEFR